MSIAAGILLGTLLLSAPPGDRRTITRKRSIALLPRLFGSGRTCLSPNDKGEGFENKIAELFAAKLKVPLKYTWYPNSIGFLRNTLRVRRCDVVMGTVTGAELAQTTNPYYRSVYVMVTRKADNITADKIEDPALKNLKIGLTAGAPPADIAAKNGLAANIRPYDLFVDTRGPEAGPGHDRRSPQEGDRRGLALGADRRLSTLRSTAMTLKVTPLLNEPKSTRMEFYITMAVRPGENQWKNDINTLIRENKDEIDKILRDYHIPLLNQRGEMIQ